jgi:hypothetical protein
MGASILVQCCRPKNNTLISAGIQVQKQQKVGLTVAIHCWDKQLESDVKLGHEDYTVK